MDDEDKKETISSFQLPYAAESTTPENGGNSNNHDFSPQQDTLRTGNTSTQQHPTVFEIFQKLKRETSHENASGGSGTTPPLGGPPPGVLREGASVRSHHRNVSWDPNSVFERPPRPESLQQPALDPWEDQSKDSRTNEPPPFNLRQRTPSNGDRVTLEDVIQQTPMESEAETTVMRSIEDRDPTRDRLDSSANSTILSQVPDEATSAFSQDFHGSSTRSMTGPRSARTLLNLAKHRRTETAEQKLFSLAAAIDAAHVMNQVHVETDQTETTPFVRDRTHTHEPHVEAAGSSDALQQNANILYQRSMPPVIDDSTSTSSDQEPSTLGGNSAASRWRRLKTAVTVGIVPEYIQSEPNVTDTKEESGDEEIGNIGESSLPSEHNNDDDYDNGKTKTRKRKKPTIEDIKVFRDWQEFFNPRKARISFYVKIIFVYLGLPMIGIAAILFYFCTNPPTGVLANNGNPINGTLYLTDGKEFTQTTTASASWWLLFLFRQILVASMAKCLEFFFIDFLSIRSGHTVKLLGPWVTLFVMQSRGWPFLLFIWGLLDYALLAGSPPFFSHWGYWQHFVDLFNESNPSGNVVDSDKNRRMLAVVISLGAVVAVKRFWLGLHQGKATFTQFSDRLTLVMGQILLISEVASLGRDFERAALSNNKASGRTSSMHSELDHKRLSKFISSMHVDDSSADGLTTSQSVDDDEIDMIIDPSDRHPITGSLSSIQKARISQLLGMWEEPKVAEKKMEYVSVNALLQFRRALACLHTPYVFSGSFGLADRRESCVESAQEVYYRLMLETPFAKHLSFDVIAALGVSRDGSLDQDKLKDMIRLFRPDRDGTITLLDFCKSIDAVYKDLRTLRASVVNATKIDHAFEAILNVIFYAIVITVIMSQLGFNPLALFLSISGVILAFAFMIGSASSKYFEGLLFILVRRPYDIGDGVHVSNPEAETSYTGSAWWTVEDVNLFTTSVIFMFTGERATLSNGSLASARIINSSRSPNAYLYIMLKFPINSSMEKLQSFSKAVEDFFRNRPREWISLVSFRATNVEAAMGYIEYIVVGQHRQGWADWGALQLSKSHLMHFCLEIQKKLDMYYRSPPLPVDVNNSSITNYFNHIGNAATYGGEPLSPAGASSRVPQSPDLSSVQAQFAPKDQRKDGIFR